MDLELKSYLEIGCTMEEAIESIRIANLDKGLLTMATTTPATKTTPIKKERKAPVAPIIRLTDTMKRAAMAGKLKVEDLDKLANLANALKTFISA